jgi:hypothetical protein
LQSLESVALTLAKLENYSQAAPIMERLLRSKQSMLGLDHADCIEVMGVLAFVLIRTGELEEASKLLEHVSGWQKKHLDPTEPCVSATNEAISTLKKSLVEL